MARNYSDSPTLRMQTAALCIVGAIAVICFVLSFMLDGGSSLFRTLGYVFGGIAALIGVSFAFTGRDR